MKGYDYFVKNFRKNQRPPHYAEIVDRYEVAAAHFYGGEKNMQAIMDKYRFSESLVRKDDRLKLTMSVCKDYFKNFTNGVTFTLLSNTLLTKGTAKREDGTEEETDAKVQIVAPESVRQYAFDENDLWNFFKKLVVPKCLLDPNGILVAIPSGAGLTDAAIPVDVKIWYIPFKSIHYISAEEVVFEFGGYYYYVSETEYRRFTIKGNKVVPDTWSYPHGLKYSLWSALGGIVTDFDSMVTDESDYTNTGDQFYMLDSYIAHAFEKATLAVRVFTDIEIMRQTHTHPYIEMESRPCTACNGEGCRSNMAEFVDSCECSDRSGEVKPNLPIGAVLYRKKDMFADPNKPESSKPLLSFTAPDTTAIDLQIKYLETCKNDVKEALNMFKVEEKQSGVAKEWDDSFRQLAVSEIASNLYDLMRKTLQWINDLRKESDSDIEINLPDDWKLKP
jgi:hypothetical protein